MIPHDAHLHIGSLLFEGIDQIDLTGPFEVLSRLPNTIYRSYGKTVTPAAKTQAPSTTTRSLTGIAPKNGNR